SGMNKQESDRFSSFDQFLVSISAFYEKYIESIPSEFPIGEHNSIDYSNTTITYHSINRLHAAISKLNKAIVVDPKTGILYSNRGSFFGELGKIDEALTDFSTALEHNPDLYQAYFNRGRIYYQTDRYEQALADYTSAISVFPEYEDALTAR